VLVVGVDGVRFDFLGADCAPSVWALGRDAADEAITARAAAILAGQAPRLSFVYLGAVDFAGHATGSGATYRAALRAADQRVGRLVAAVRSRPSGAEDDWTIVITRQQEVAPLVLAAAGCPEHRG